MQIKDFRRYYHAIFPLFLYDIDIKLIKENYREFAYILKQFVYILKQFAYILKQFAYILITHNLEYCAFLLLFTNSILKVFIICLL